MPIIKTPEDWWDAVDENWDDLLSLCCRFGPSDEQLKMLPLYELALVTQAGSWTGYVIQLKMKRYSEPLHFVFERVWASAPDVPGLAKEFKAWPALCDLCSEFWVFDDRW